MTESRLIKIDVIFYLSYTVLSVPVSYLKRRAAEVLPRLEAGSVRENSVLPTHHHEEQWRKSGNHRVDTMTAKCLWLTGTALWH